MAPLQVGSCVTLRKKDWRHVVGIIQAAVDKDEFMVHWTAPVEEGHRTGKYKKSQLMHGPPPDSPASFPSSSPVSLHETGSKDLEDAKSVTSVTSIASLSSEDTDDLVGKIRAAITSFWSEVTEETDDAIAKIRAAQQGQNGHSSGCNDEDFWDINPDEILDEEIPLQCIEIEEYQALHHTVAAANVFKRQYIADGFSITVKQGGENSNGQSFEWQMIKDHEPETRHEDNFNIGVAGFNLAAFSKRDFPILDLFLHLFPVEIDRQLKVMNAKIDFYKNKGILGINFNLVSMREIYSFFAILFAAHACGGGGERLWDVTSDDEQPAPDFGSKYCMTMSRFQDIKRVFPFFFTNPLITEKDDKWYMIQWFVDQFNANRKLTFCASHEIIVDETMSAWEPRTINCGNGAEDLDMPALPHLSFIHRKPEPLGTEFKVAACAQQRVFLHLEIQRGKEDMKDAKYTGSLGAQSACAIRLLEESTGAGRKTEDLQVRTSVHPNTFRFLCKCVH